VTPTETPARPPLPHGYPPADLYARLGDDPLHGALRRFDDEFLAANRDTLRDYAAHWVADPLQHWSRRWEYPYVFERLAAWNELRGADAGGLRILDAGSGLTFFPHYLASTLPVERIECCDRDPAMERDARRLHPPASASVDYGTQDLSRLSYADASFDCIYCISVLEHTTERERIADEFQRTLRRGGLLVVTIDVSLDGRAEIPREEAALLMAELERRFEPLDPFVAGVSAPGRNLLTTRNVGKYEPSLVPPRTYASAGGVARRLLKPHTFPWGKALRRLRGGAGGGSAASELSFFCTTWVKAPGAVPPVGA
jgi:SAM-dependent methyltransferase